MSLPICPHRSITKGSHVPSLPPPLCKTVVQQESIFPSKSFVPNYLFPASVTVMLPLFFTNNLTRTVCYVLIDTPPCRAELISYLSSKKKNHLGLY